MISVPHDVIISYSTIDKTAADAVCAKLEERGIRCWIAPRDISAGMQYAEAIVSAIDSARVMVLIFSSHANASKHVKREAERAVHDGIPIIPFRIEDVEPTLSLQYYISAQQWLDALTPPLEQHIPKLAESISILLGKPIPPPTQAVPTSPLLRNRAVIVTIIALVVVAVIGTGLYAFGIFKPSSGDMVTYQNLTAGVKFSYPKNWTVSANPTQNGTYPNEYYEIYPPNYETAQSAIGFYKLSKAPFSADTDNATVLGAINYDMYSSSDNSANFTVVQNVTSTTLGGKPALEWAARDSDQSSQYQPYEWFGIYTVRGDNIYLVAYWASPSYYATMSNDAQRVINSFEFIRAT